jgi:heptosyltransferase-2
MYVGAPVAVRRWPPGNFAQVADFAAKELGARVAVLAGAAESAVAREVRARCRNPEQAFLFTDLTIPQLAAIIGRSRLLLSNDTGPMHIGPVLGVPTLGLFSVGYPEHYCPLGERSRFLRANPIETISIQDVIQNVREIWSLTPES